jgi:anti-anti-sigma factor
MLKPRVQVRNEGGVLVAEFWDCLRLDPAPVQDLRKEFDAHLRAQGRPDVVVDLNGVTFAGSAALGMFLALNRLARQRGGRVTFCNVDPGVFEVFRVSKLMPLFQFEADMPAALAAANGPPPAPTPKAAPDQADGKPKGGPGGAPLRRARRGAP